MTGALAVVVRSGSILMIRRGTEPFSGYWCPPGGVQESGESLEETAIRETKEETGLEVDVVKELGRVVGPLTGHYHHMFLCRPSGGSLEPSLPEATEARWAPYKELPNLSIPPFIREFLDKLDLRHLEKIDRGSRS